MKNIVALIAVDFLVGIASSATRAEPSPQQNQRPVTQDCRPVSAADSADFVNLVRDIASSTTDGAPARALAMLPLVSADSVQSLMSPAACDSAAVYSRAALIAKTGNSNTPLLPMRLVRVSSNRIVGDPAVLGGPGNKPQYVTFDSTFTVVKIWHAGP